LKRGFGFFALKWPQQDNSVPDLPVPLCLPVLLAMNAYLLSDHLLNFIAPAAFVALGLVLLTRLLSVFSRSKSAAAPALWAQLAIILIANLVVLVVGLLVFGKDGKMATYAALVVVAATCQWLFSRKRI
jgi:hypothetical protein